MVKGAFFHLRNIAKIRKYINTATAEVFVHSFVSTKLDFATRFYMAYLSMKLTNCKVFKTRQPV